ncbi:MAG TPA: hypothetical protein VFM97_07685 [Gammaproteobacteria bacterium]|nr:hypothetical protein [Gammaproteobacteria bacterium]
MDIGKSSVRLLGGVAFGVMILLAGCAPEPTQPASLPQPRLAAAPATGACTNCGVITSVQSLSPTDYQVSIRLDNGSVQTIALPTQPAFQVGDRVQILSQPPTYPAY